MNIAPKFIVVDDDKFNNALCTMVIRRICPDAEVLTFHDPIEGYDYIINDFPNFSLKHPVVLLLDINMPVLDGWVFLENLNRFIKAQKQPPAGRLIIYVLSSSVDRKDIDKAIQYPNVIDYIIKPITKDIILQIVDLLSK